MSPISPQLDRYFGTLRFYIGKGVFFNIHLCQYKTKVLEQLIGVPKKVVLEGILVVIILAISAPLGI